MRKLIATSALALIVSGPAFAQATQGTMQQQPQSGTEAGQQPMQAETVQQPGQQQQMAGGQGFYQPQGNDLFVSELMDAQVYAPAEGQGGMMQQGQMQQGQMQQPVGQQAQPMDQQAGTTTTVTPTDQQQAAGTQPAEGQMAQGTAADTTAVQPGQQPMAQQQQPMAQQQPGVQPGMEGQAGTAAFRERQVTQDELQGMENIGSVADVIVDEQGEIRAVVVNVGGFLGLGAREVALSFDQIDFAREEGQDGYRLISQVGANELQNAPEFDRAQLGEQRQWQQGGMQQGGVMQQQQPQQQAQAGAQPGAAATGAATGAAVGTAATTQQQATAQPGTAQPGMAQPGAQNWRADRQAMAAPQMQREGFQQAQPQEITADNLIGANVYDINDENIGSVSDVVMGGEGQAQYSVLDVGGFLGFGTHTVAIGFDEMQVLHDEGWADLRVYVDVTREELEAMPEYVSAQN